VSPLRLNPELPAGFEPLVYKALEKDRNLRYQSAADLRSDLARLKRDLDSGRSPSAAASASVAGVTASSASVAAAGAVSAVAPPAFSRKYLLGGIAALVLLAGTAAILWPRGKTETAKITSIAVLPFVNATADPNNEYLSDGLTESLIGTMSQLPNLKVLARSTVFRFKGNQDDPQKIGQTLQVGAVLMGRVTQRGDELSVQADLVNTADGTELWGSRYSRKLADITQCAERHHPGRFEQAAGTSIRHGATKIGARRHHQSGSLPALSGRAAAVVWTDARGIKEKHRIVSTCHCRRP
jgi:TolB-like protein